MIKISYFMVRKMPSSHTQKIDPKKWPLKKADDQMLLIYVPYFLVECFVIWTCGCCYFIALGVSHNM